VTTLHTGKVRNQDPVTGRDKKSFLFSDTSRPALGLPSLPFSDCQQIYPHQWSGWGVTLTTRFHLMPQLETSIAIFRFLWPCIMNIGWKERNQQDATNPTFIIKHVSGIIYTWHAHIHTAIYIYTRNPNYVCYALPHTKTLWLSLLSVFSIPCYSAEHHTQQYTVLFSWWWA